MTYKFPVQPEAEILIGTIDGDLKLEGHALEEIRANGDDPLIKVTNEKSHIEIESNGDCELKVPASAHVIIETVGGDAKMIRRLNHEIHVTDVGGDMAVQDLKELHVSTVGGDFEAKRIEGSVHIGSIGADAEFSDIQGEIQVDTIGADVKLKDVTGTVEINDIGSDLVLITEIRADYHINSVGGDVVVKLQSDDGVRFVIPAHAAQNIGLSNAHIEQDGDTATITLGDPKATVTIEHIGGDLRLAGSGHDGDDIDIDLEDMIPDNLDEIIQARINDQMWKVRRASEKALHEAEQAHKRALHEAEHARQRAAREAQKAQHEAEKAMHNAQRQAHQHGRDWHVEFSWPGGVKEKRKNGQPFPPNPPYPPAPPVPPMPPFGKRKRVNIEVHPESEPVSDEERLTILRMVENKQITVEEAERLLSALEGR